MTTKVNQPHVRLFPVTRRSVLISILESSVQIIECFRIRLFKNRVFRIYSNLNGKEKGILEYIRMFENSYQSIPLEYIKILREHNSVEHSSSPIV